MTHNVADLGASSSIRLNSDVEDTNINPPGAEITNDDADGYDMFADDDDINAKPSSDSSNMVSGSNSSGCKLVAYLSSKLETSFLR